MWNCPYCGGSQGQPFFDHQLQGMLCLDPQCGRFDVHDDQAERFSDSHESDF